MSFVEFFALNLYRTDRDVVFCGRGDNGGRASQQHNHTYIYNIIILRIMHTHTHTYTHTSFPQ
jgi:NAD(P)H-hydrate repair Nnr-like enzyme with NAD(P)H-hydrate epimerase domain